MRVQTGVAYRPHGEGTKQAEPIDLISILSATTSPLPTGDLAIVSQVEALLGLPTSGGISDAQSLLTTQKFVNPHKVKEPTHNLGTASTNNFDLNYLRQCSADPAASKMPIQLPSLDWTLFAPKPTAAVTDPSKPQRPRNPLSASNSPLGSASPGSPRTPKAGIDRISEGGNKDVGEGVLLLNDLKKGDHSTLPDKYAFLSFSASQTIRCFAPTQRSLTDLLVYVCIQNSAEFSDDDFEGCSPRSAVTTSGWTQTSVQFYRCIRCHRFVTTR